MVCGPLVVYVYAYTSREIEKERERERVQLLTLFLSKKRLIMASSCRTLSSDLQ